MAKKVLHNIATFLFKSCLYVISLLPFWILYGLSTILALILSNIKRLPVNVATRRNMRRAFPEKNPKEIKELNRLYFQAFGDFLVEFVKCPRYSRKQMMTRCKFKNLELVEEKFKTHRFIICYGGHMVNYEYQVCFPLYLPNYGMCHLYLDTPDRAVDNEGVNWVMKIRSRYGAINIPSYSPIRTLLKLQKQFDEGTNEKNGYIFGTLSDMDTFAPNPHCSTFFNRDLEVMTGAERIGRKLNMAFMYAYITRPNRGRYEIEFIEMSPDDFDTNACAYTDAFVRLLEKNICEQPELWMQWGTNRF